MTIHFNEIISGLFVINLAMAFGAGVYEYRIVMPMWFGSWGIDRMAIEKTDVGRKFWGMVTTIPLTLLTFVNLYFALRSTGVLHTWWLSACILILAERIGTFSYFIPTILKLVNTEKLTDHRALKKAEQWKQFNKIRIILNMSGLVASVFAYTLLIEGLK